MDDLPDAIVRLRNPVSERNYGIDEPHRDHPQEEVERTPAAVTTPISPPAYSNNNVVVVRQLSLDNFRRRLVQHFSIAVAINEVKWPRRFDNNSVNDTNAH